MKKIIFWIFLFLFIWVNQSFSYNVSVNNIGCTWTAIYYFRVGPGYSPTYYFWHNAVTIPTDMNQVNSFNFAYSEWTYTWNICIYETDKTTLLGCSDTQNWQVFNFSNPVRVIPWDIYYLSLNITSWFVAWTAWCSLSWYSEWYWTLWNRWGTLNMSNTTLSFAYVLNWNSDIIVLPPINPYNYETQSCNFIEKYNWFFSYVNFDYTQFNEVVPSYVPENTQVFHLLDSDDSVKLFTWLIWYNSFSWSVNAESIYWNTPIDIESRTPILKYDFLWWSWGENLNQEIGGYSDRYTKFAISTGSGSYFNYLELKGSWIGGSAEINNFIIEYYDLNQNNIVSISKLMDFWEKINLPSLTRRVNIYFKDWSEFALDKINIWQANKCTLVNDVYTPTITEELIWIEPVVEPDNTAPNFYIDDQGLEWSDYQAISTDVVFFPADWTQATNTVTTPEACETEGATWAEDYWCVRGFFNQFIVKWKIIVENSTKLFKELLKIWSDEEKTFFSFSFIQSASAYEAQSSTGYTTAFVDQMNAFKDDDTKETNKMLKFFYWGLILVVVIVTFVVSFKVW